MMTMSTEECLRLRRLGIMCGLAAEMAGGSEARNHDWLLYAIFKNLNPKDAAGMVEFAEAEKKFRTELKAKLPLEYADAVKAIYVTVGASTDAALLFESDDYFTQKRRAFPDCQYYVTQACLDFIRRTEGEAAVQAFVAANPIPKFECSLGNFLGWFRVQNQITNF
jgi:hypothetical protein